MNRPHRFPRSARGLRLLAAAVLAGCSSSPASSSGPCDRTTDCAAGLVCADGACVAPTLVAIDSAGAPADGGAGGSGGDSSAGGSGGAVADCEHACEAKLGSAESEYVIASLGACGCGAGTPCDSDCQTSCTSANDDHGTCLACFDKVLAAGDPCVAAGYEKCTADATCIPIIQCTRECQGLGSPVCDSGFSISGAACASCLQQGSCCADFTACKADATCTACVTAPTSACSANAAYEAVVTCFKTCEGNASCAGG